MPKLSKYVKRLLALSPILIGVAIVVVLMRTRSEPVVKPVSEIGVALRTIEAPAVDLVPRVNGYGLAEPARVWQAVAQVPGRAVFVSPRLKAGMIIDDGEVLVRIDPADYELAVARLEAAIAETRARLSELDAEENHRRASLEIEKSSLALAEASLERKRAAMEKGAITPDDVDRETRSVLQQRQTIQAIENALGLLPAKRKALDATLASHQANLEQAKLDLGRTEIKAPFRCRLADVSIEQDQFVRAGQTIFEAHGAAAVEIQAKFRPEQMRSLLPADKRSALESGLTMKSLRDVFDLSAMVRVRSGEWEASWPARFDRVRETVDPRTRAINVVAIVDDPYDKVVPGVRPALVRGMYCELELRASARTGTVVLPRSAVYGKMVYVLDGDGRLRERSVRIAFTQEEFAVVEAGVNAGETVVVSDPAPAIEGMRIHAIPDAVLLDRIVQSAQGRESTP